MHKIVMALALASALLATGCSDQCAGLQVTDRDRIAVENGGEVEREGTRGGECELSSENPDRFQLED